MDIVPVDEVPHRAGRPGLSAPARPVSLPWRPVRVFKLTPCENKQANIVQCLQEEQLESITFAQFREWAHGPEGEQKDDGYVYLSQFLSHHL